MDEITDEELEEIQRRADDATSGPWFVRHLDDDYAMSLVAVSIEEATADEYPRWPDFDGSTMVAATLVQEPRYVSIGDGRVEANAEFIAHARQDIPRLIAEIRRRRAARPG